MPENTNKNSLPGFDAQRQNTHVVGGMQSGSFDKNIPGFQGGEFLNSNPDHILNNKSLEKNFVSYIRYDGDKEVEISQNEPWVCELIEEQTVKGLYHGSLTEFKDTHTNKTYVLRREIEEYWIAIDYSDGSIWTYREYRDGKVSFSSRNKSFDCYRYKDR